MQKNRIATLLALLKDAPNDSFVLFALAKEYEKNGEPEKSLKWFATLKKIDPEYVGLYYHLGVLYRELGRKKEALSTFQEGIQIANKENDLHAKSELMGALQNLELELD